MSLRGWRGRTWVVAGLLTAFAVGCTSEGTDGDGARGTPSASASASESPGAAESEAPSPTQSPAHPVSIPALIEREHRGSDLELGTVLDRNDSYTRYAVTYQADDLTISGILNVPRGEGPFPALVLAHGYIDPEVYVTGQGMAREQDLLARNGYVVLHTDYRNHAGSDDDPDNDINLRLGYTEDVIAAVMALRSAELPDGLPEIDDDRIGLVGRSMGGGVVYNTMVVAPGLVDAAVVFASVSSRPIENYGWFPRPSEGPQDESPLTRLEAEYGSYEENPTFWDEAAPVTYFDRVTEPLLMHHGTSDDTCPLQWSQDTAAALEAEGKDVELITYEGEEHAFVPQWPESMENTMDFLERNLR